MKKIILIVGARPNFMKAFPVYQVLREDFELTLIHTGQHFDSKMSDVFFNQLGFPVPDIHLSLESKSRAGELDTKLYVDNKEYLRDKNIVIQELIETDYKKLGQLGEIKYKLEIEFDRIKPDMVIVFGDVTSTLAAGLAAKNLNIELSHVESGLRSGDLEMPEEVNRILTDHISTYYFVTEQSGVNNLKNEGIEDNVYLVGNTMIDCLFMFKDKALETKYHEKIGLKSKEYVLVTLHRPGNVDNLDKLREIFDDLIELAKNEKIVYPVHPRTKTNLEKIGYLEKINSNQNIILEEPLGYLEFTCLESNAKYVITDSGGIQEETTALNVPCFTLRPNTERPCTLIENCGTNTLINKLDEIKLKECVGNIDDLWDGKSSEKILTKLKSIKNKLVIFFDCHGREIYKYLNLNKRFIKHYEVIYLNLNDYVLKEGKYYNNNNLSKSHIIKIKLANVLILQIIEKDRKFLNNDKIIEFCNKNCLILKIPHYRNSVYEYKIMDGFINKKELFIDGNFNDKWNLPKKIINIDNVENTINIIKNEIKIMNKIENYKNDFEKSLNFKITEFQSIDKLSDIKMNDYYLLNYKK